MEITTTPHVLVRLAREGFENDFLQKATFNLKIQLSNLGVKKRGKIKLVFVDSLIF